MKNALLCVLLCVIAPSCWMSKSSTNEPLELRLIQTIKPGMSAAEVVRLLGAPAFVVELEPRKAYLYEHNNSKTAGLMLVVLVLSNTDTRSDRAWVFFDENDKVTHIGATLASARAEYAMPWQDLYDELPESQAGQQK